VPRKGLSPSQDKRDQGLTKKERALRAIAGGEVDRRPFTFWHPFGVSHMKADSLTAAAITFAATYAVDLLRMPAVRDLPLPGQSSLDRPHDLTTVEVMAPRQGFWGERLEALKSIVRLADGKIAVFETVPDPLTALSWVVPPEVLGASERNHATFLEKALGVVSESLQGYLKVLLGEAKVDGVVIEVGSASFEQRQPEDFEKLVKPHLKALMESVESQAPVPVWLQVSGRRAYLDPLLDLPHDLLSWSHLAHGPSLEKLPRRQRARLAGGLNEVALESMSFQDIRRHVDEARNLPVALLCPGGALSADTAPSRLRALSNFLMKRDRLPETAPAGAGPERVIDEP
jgi:uroporphyrinogen-III decarboxylase